MKIKSIEEYKRHFLEEWNKLQDLKDPSYIYDPIKHIIQSEGKRLRPIIVQFLGDIFENDSNDTINAAMGVELLHNFTLVHDDIMDEDTLRHNVTTIHEKWDNAHAILSGDALGALGPIYIGKIKTNTLEVLVRYNEVILEVCEGQAYDMEFENRNASVNDYLLMSKKKTGSLFSLCFEIPALMSEIFLEHRQSLKELGENLGIIFQMQDDILEMLTSEENMGKGTSSDIERRKKTVLSSIAFEYDKENWEKLQNQIKSIDIVEKKQVLGDYFKESGVLNKANDLLSSYEKKCKEVVNSLPKDIQNDVGVLLNLIIKRHK